MYIRGVPDTARHADTHFLGTARPDTQISGHGTPQHAIPGRGNSWARHAPTRNIQPTRANTQAPTRRHLQKHLVK